MATAQFNWTVGSGSVNTLTCTVKNTDGSLYDITGLSWAYVVRRDPGDGTTPAVVEVTQTPNAQGQITVDTVNSVVTVALLPAATEDLPARAVYGHALWSGAGTTAATDWLWGSFIINQVAQP